jgi:hypothetical protein
MHYNNYIFPIIILVITFLLASRLKILSDSQRFAVYKLGQFEKFVGPGLIFQYERGALKWVRVSIGTTGELATPDMVRIFEKKDKYFDLPVADMGSVKIGSIVRITGFTENKILCTMNPDQRKTIQCEKCGHEMAIN